MSIIEFLLIGVGLAMDAFAVACCRGVEMKKFAWKNAVLIALFFGFFQALMPLIGWAAGYQFQKYIMAVDHYIAFGLLALLGLKMIYDGIKKDKNEKCPSKFSFWTLLVLSIATSIDALVVGITFAFINANIWIAISIIGSVTFLLSFIGVWLGQKIGTKLKGFAEIAGGIILILIGTKILLEHLSVIPF